MLWWGWGASHGAPSLSSRLFLSSNTSLRAPREYVWQNDVAFFAPRIDQTASQIHDSNNSPFPFELPFPCPLS